MSTDVQPTPASPSSPKQRWAKRFFYHPTLNVIWGIIGTIGTGFTIYGLFFTNSEPNLTYYVSPNRIPIVQKGVINELSVRFGSEPIVGDLSAVHVQLWNQGRAPIRKEDVLKQIAITAEGNIPIYQVTMTAKRPVSDITYHPHSMGRPDVVDIDWRILEKGDGADFQIIYGGNIKARFSVDGTIVGQAHITASSQPTGQRGIIGILSLLGTAYFVNMGIRILLRDGKTWHRGPDYKFVVVLEVLLTLLALSLFLYLLFTIISAPPQPPFGV